MLAEAWYVRHVTKLLLGAGVLLLIDSRTTGLVVPLLDEEFDFAKSVDTPRAWRDYVAEGGRPEKARIEMARLHEAVRVYLRGSAAPRPDGLDPLLAVLKANVESRVYLEAEPLAVDRTSFTSVPAVDLAAAELVPLGETLDASDWSCAAGMSEAFAAATGGETIVVETPDSYDANVTATAPRIRMSWSARASGTWYGGRTDKYLFPGIAVTATLRLVSGDQSLAELETTVDPGMSFEFTTNPSPFGPSVDVDDVASGMIRAACRGLAEQLIAELTGLAPAVGSRPGDRGTAIEKCEANDAEACLLAGEQLRESDPKRAIELLTNGCNSGGLYAGAACEATAELALAQPGSSAEGLARAIIASDTGCRGHHPESCARAADLKLQSYGDPPPEGAQRESFVLRLRACDLGHMQSCEVRDARFPLDRREFFGVALAEGEHAYAMRWGMWFEHTAHEVVWIASPQTRAAIEDRLATEIAMGRARLYDPNALHAGQPRAEGATTVFAIVDLPRSVLGEVRRCPECTGDAALNPFFAIMCECLPVRQP